jgi:hypothetical protein
MLKVKGIMRTATRVTMLVSMFVLVTGCGLKDSLQDTEGKSKGADIQGIEIGNESGLSLLVPSDLPSWLDTVQVTLYQIDAAPGDCQSVSSDGKLLGRPCLLGAASSTTPSNFPLNGKPIKINGLKAGRYGISVTILNAKTGQVYSQGEGTVIIQAGKTATANITMRHVSDGTGGLVIVLEEPGTNVAPPIAPLPPQFLPPLSQPGLCAIDQRYRPAQCVVVGKSLIYRYMFETVDPKTCQWGFPVGYQKVDASHCKGLPQPE